MLELLRFQVKLRSICIRLKKLLCKSFLKYFYIHRNLKNKTIHNINELRKACDENNITEFRKILYLKNTHIQDDDMVVGLTEELMKVISL